MHACTCVCEMGCYYSSLKVTDEEADKIQKENKVPTTTTPPVANAKDKVSLKSLSCNNINTIIIIIR